ncbi:MAG: hypothetical protein JSW51_10865 [Gemmatimonadota bacterium]|nr:MAG: hypothetical protein JSW51_10865 [Gemmatimonadota bacterium]
MTRPIRRNSTSRPLFSSTALALAATAVVISCVEDISLNPRPPEEGTIPTYLVVTVDSADWPTDPVDINNSLVRGDTLALDVGYSGGCRIHLYAFVVSAAFQETNPVQTVALLSHDENDDECDAVTQDSLRADLSALKTKYQESYQTERGEIVIHIDGAWAVRYVF